MMLYSQGDSGEGIQYDPHTTDVGSSSTWIKKE
jgi:hypothetical protein